MIIIRVMTIMMTMTLKMMMVALVAVLHFDDE
jgi:hypothetical protein